MAARQEPTAVTQQRAGGGLLPGAGRFVARLTTSTRTARWIVPTFAAAFRGTEESTVDAPARLLLLLRVAALERCPYWRTHWEAAARALGVAEDKIIVVGTEDWETAPAFEARERAAVLWGDRVARRLAQRDKAAYTAVTREFTVPEVAELTLVASLAAMAVRAANALRVPPEPPAAPVPATTPVTREELAGWSARMFDTDVAELARKGSWGHE